MKSYLNSKPAVGSFDGHPLPARLDVPTVAKLLGFAEHDIPTLISAGLLTPLGKPADNAPKFFARVVVEQLAVNSEWLHDATCAVANYWKHKRQRQVGAHATAPAEESNLVERVS